MLPDHPWTSPGTPGARACACDGVSWSLGGVGTSTGHTAVLQSSHRARAGGRAQMRLYEGVGAQEVPLTAEVTSKGLLSGVRGISGEEL